MALRQGDDPQTGHAAEEALEALAVRRPVATASAGDEPKRQRAREPAAVHVVELGGKVDELVGRQRHEVGKHDLRDRSHPRQGHAVGDARDARLGDRRRKDLLREACRETLAHLERAAVGIEQVLADQHDLGRTRPSSRATPGSAPQRRASNLSLDDHLRESPPCRRSARRRQRRHPDSSSRGHSLTTWRPRRQTRWPRLAPPAHPRSGAGCRESGSFSPQLCDDFLWTVVVALAVRHEPASLDELQERPARPAPSTTTRPRCSCSASRVVICRCGSPRGRSQRRAAARRPGWSG